MQNSAAELCIFCLPNKIPLDMGKDADVEMAEMERIQRIRGGTHLAELLLSTISH